MPELPEVETVARQLAPGLVGRTVTGLRVLDERLRGGRRFPSLRSRPVVDVRRSGKRVLLAFGPPPRGGAPLWLAVHLRMTGRLIRLEEPRRDPVPHLRARMTLDRGELLFVDTRRFGTFDWYRDESAAAPHATDPLDPTLDGPALRALIAESRTPIKTWLLRQDRLVGIGNIYASEALHSARISPLREAGSLDDAECRRLVAAVRRILLRAIDACGTTFSDFQDSNGVEGGYARYLRVYDREGLRCRRCRGTIERLVQQQRSTYHCPACQL